MFLFPLFYVIREFHRFLHRGKAKKFQPGRSEGRSRAEILARLPEQIFLKRRLRLHKESFSPFKRAVKSHVIAFKFQPGLKYEIGHAHKLCTKKKHVKRFPANFPAQF